MKPVIIITGTSRGLGLAMAHYYAAKGYHVVGCSRRRLEKEHVGYVHHVVDVADELSVVAMVRETARQFGRIDALVNNAGTAFMNHALLTTRRSFVEVMNTNLLGTFLVSREVAKIMLARKTGRIVNLVSVATPLQIEGEAAYAASKAGVENLTGVLAHELGPHGITVNAIGPTPMDTDLIKGIPRDKLRALENRQAIARRGTADDVINVVDFFLSERSGFVTGQVLYLGGIS